VELHVILECVAAVEPLGAEVAGEGHLAAVDEVVLLEVVLHAEPLGADAAPEGAGRILHGVEGVGKEGAGGYGRNQAWAPVASKANSPSDMVLFFSLFGLTFISGLYGKFLVSYGLGSFKKRPIFTSYISGLLFFNRKFWIFEIACIKIDLQM
jgi:hypothetical protein